MVVYEDELVIDVVTRQQHAHRGGKLNLQSLLSVDSFSNRQSVPTFPGKSSTSESVCRHSISSPTRISSGYSPMSFRQVVSVCESEKYFSMMPAFPSCPVISDAASG